MMATEHDWRTNWLQNGYELSVVGVVGGGQPIAALGNPQILSSLCEN